MTTKFKGRSLKAAALSVIAALALLVAAVPLAGCSGGETSGSSSNSSDATAASEPAKVRIGTMPTEDFLPMWVAEQDGLFEQVGVDAELVVFDSAQTLSSAIAGGEVDMAMVDVMRAAKLCEAGTSVDIEWVTLGTEPDQGVFGVMAPADAPYSTLAELAQMAEAGDPVASLGIGVAANTVPEYVYEMLCKQQGVDPSVIPVQEVASLPERYGLMASGNIAAAALPASLLELGKASGMKLLADDSEGENISQSVMVATSGFALENADVVKLVAEAWDLAADAIAADPSDYAALLAEKANLNSAVADTYEIAAYPHALVDGELAHIDGDLVEPLLSWMTEKGYLTKGASFDAETGAFTIS